MLLSFLKLINKRLNRAKEVLLPFKFPMLGEISVFRTAVLILYKCYQFDFYIVCLQINFNDKKPCYNKKL